MQVKPIISKVLFWVIPAFFLIVVIQQWWDYQQLKNDIGKHAYTTAGYALRQLGKPGTYIGVVQDVKWNAFPIQKDDVKGLQPRYLIAREVVSGVTEEQWWCTYLFELKENAPKRFKPSPFPPMTYMEGAIP